MMRVSFVNESCRFILWDVRKGLKRIFHISLNLLIKIIFFPKIRTSRRILQLRAYIDFWSHGNWCTQTWEKVLRPSLVLLMILFFQVFASKLLILVRRKSLVLSLFIGEGRDQAYNLVWLARLRPPGGGSRRPRGLGPLICLLQVDQERNYFEV